jgi:diacylglycerol kinase family enzyme
MAVRVPLSALFGTALARRIFSPVRARVSVDGEELPEDHFTMLVAATVANVGLGVRITYRAEEDAERFHMIASALPARSLARQFGRTFRGRPLRGPQHHDLLARRAEITFAEPQPCTVDGELLRATRVELAAGEPVAICRTA